MFSKRKALTSLVDDKLAVLVLRLVSIQGREPIQQPGQRGFARAPARRQGEFCKTCSLGSAVVICSWLVGSRGVMQRYGLRVPGYGIKVGLMMIVHLVPAALSASQHAQGGAGVQSLSLARVCLLTLLQGVRSNGAARGSPRNPRGRLGLPATSGQDLKVNTSNNAAVARAKAFAIAGLAARPAGKLKRRQQQQTETHSRLLAAWDGKMCSCFRIR